MLPLVACGNGIAEPDEECDDGNTLDADGCSGGCELEVCGNGRLDPAELCEPPDIPSCDNRWALSPGRICLFEAISSSVPSRRIAPLG